MSRKSRSDDQFVRWDDLDLSALLGDFTDTEREERCDSIEPGEEHQDMASLKHDLKRTEYICPVEKCGRKYSSFAGFRGHVTKKHQLFDLKATEHINGANISRVIQNSSIEENHPMCPQLVRRTLTNIQMDKSNQNSNSKFGHVMIQIASIAVGFCEDFDWLTEFMFSITGATISSGQSADREHLMQGFVQLCNNDSLREAFVKFLLQTVKVDQPINIMNMFVTIFLEEFLDEYLKTQANSLKKDFVECKTKISENDQEILYYISGYIINKSLRSKSISSHFKDVLETFLEEADKENLAAATWTNKLDRGGLRHPKKSVLDLFRITEVTVRNFVDVSSIGPHSLNKTAILENILESDRVKRAWSVIVPGFCQNMDLCKKILGLFLTVRGFAMAKLVKRQLEKKRTARNTKSLRKSLKAPRLIL